MVKVIRLAVVVVGEVAIEYSTLAQILVAVIEISSAVPVIMFYFFPFTFVMSRVIADTSLDAQGSGLYLTKIFVSMQSELPYNEISANSPEHVKIFGFVPLMPDRLVG